MDHPHDPVSGDMHLHFSHGSSHAGVEPPACQFGNRPIPERLDLLCGLALVFKGNGVRACAASTKVGQGIMRGSEKGLE